MAELMVPERFVFWGCAAFEVRSRSVLKALKNDASCGVVRSYIFYDSENDACVAACRDFEAVTTKNIEFIELKYQDPIFSADCFRRVLDSCVNEGITEFVIDFTTFTREWILMLLAIFRLEKYNMCNMLCAYNYAKSMSQDWLSRGPMDLRTVLGYPGIFLSSRRTHLFLILGHEAERALAIIDSVEPAVLTIATGSAGGSVTKDMHDRNLHFKEYIRNCYSVKTLEIEIDVKSFAKSKSDIINALNGVQGYNIIVAPLNTKISTIAAGCACLENKNFQMCYLPMEQYNTKDFSEASDENVFFKI